jgi:hypothetical protein
VSCSLWGGGEEGREVSRLVSLGVWQPASHEPTVLVLVPGLGTRVRRLKGGAAGAEGGGSGAGEGTPLQVQVAQERGVEEGGLLLLVQAGRVRHVRLLVQGHGTRGLHSHANE